VGGAHVKAIGAVVLTLAVSVAVRAPDVSSAAAPTVKKVPRELWAQYPLGPLRSETTPAAARPDPTKKTNRPMPALRPQAKHRGFRLTPVVVAGLGLAVLGLLGFGILLEDSSSRRGKGGRIVRDFLRSHGSTEQQANMGEGQMERADDRVGRPAEDRDAEPVAESNLAGVGDHITSVLAAAERAASKLRAEAEQDARQLRDQAQQAVTELRLKAKQEGETARASAQLIVEEAEAAAADTRGEADRYADNRRREADAHAAKIVFEAERSASSIAEMSEERHRVVLTNIATSEARLRDLAKSLRGVASALDTVVGDGDGPMGAEADEELEDSLRPHLRASQSEAGSDS
jgi:hypothetical protein